MMFPIVFFLIIASTPFCTKGEEAVNWENAQPGPSESECRPYIEKALQDASSHDSPNIPRDSDDVGENNTSEEEAVQSVESGDLTSTVGEEEPEAESDEETERWIPIEEEVKESGGEDSPAESVEAEEQEAIRDEREDGEAQSPSSEGDDIEQAKLDEILEESSESAETSVNEIKDKEGNRATSGEASGEEDANVADPESSAEAESNAGSETIPDADEDSNESTDTSVERNVTHADELETHTEEVQGDPESVEEIVNVKNEREEVTATEDVSDEGNATEESEKQEESEEKNEESVEKKESKSESEEKDGGSSEKEEQLSNEETKSTESVEAPEAVEVSQNETRVVSPAEETQSESVEETTSEEIASEGVGSEEKTSNATVEGEKSSEDATPDEEDLSMIIEIPEKLRSKEHMSQILRLNKDSEVAEKLLSKTMESILRELKKLYDVAIKPLEILYKYRDLSNRHFGDPEIFSKPLILFMGPWSGGKSTIINYLLENEYKKTALRTGAEPSPAYFNIVMHGDKEEILDGTQLAADWTFSGLQKFGQGLLDRLRGLKMNHPLLEKVNIVEIPGILEIRKQVERLFPFNDACQWFIDRADIIFLVYDPSKLDVGPETEAILDQLKGREMQTRIILNKADQVKPEELMRVQGTLIWNISPLMSSTEPPVMYSASLWSLPYQTGAPTRLLHAQERAFLKDLRDAIDKRVENKIASARRFAVRVRNHAKMVDCYLTTYYNHKSFFGNKKKVSDDIIEHPQNYHIYEGLSTLTNISRYDLPDPDVYRDFFRLNPVYEFQQLSSTCTYFRGCPINRLDVSIAYDLPELVGKYKKLVEEVLNSISKK